MVRGQQSGPLAVTILRVIRREQASKLIFFISLSQYAQLWDVKPDLSEFTFTVRGYRSDMRIPCLADSSGRFFFKK